MFPYSSKLFAECLFCHFTLFPVVHVTFAHLAPLFIEWIRAQQIPQDDLSDPGKQRLTPACAYAQVDHILRCFSSHEESLAPWLPIDLWSDCVDAQADLSLCLAHLPFLLALLSSGSKKLSKFISTMWTVQRLIITFVPSSSHSYLRQILCFERERERDAHRCGWLDSVDSVVQSVRRLVSIHYHYYCYHYYMY